MNNEKKEKIINWAQIFCAITIVIGAALKIMHYPFGYSLMEIGFVSFILLNYIYVRLLKQIIQKLKNE